jgi:hypothetical protein
MSNYAEGVEAISPGLASDSATTLGKRSEAVEARACHRSFNPTSGVDACRGFPAARSSRQP